MAQVHGLIAVGASGAIAPFEVPVRTVSASTVLTAVDAAGIVVLANGATAITVTLPDAAQCRRVVSGIQLGRRVSFVRGPGSTGAVTVSAAVGQQVQSCTDTLSTYGATTSLNTTNSNSATFVPISGTQWANESNS